MQTNTQALGFFFGTSIFIQIFFFARLGEIHIPVTCIAFLMEKMACTCLCTCANMNQEAACIREVVAFYTSDSGAVFLENEHESINVLTQDCNFSDFFWSRFVKIHWDCWVFVRQRQRQQASLRIFQLNLGGRREEYPAGLQEESSSGSSMEPRMSRFEVGSVQSRRLHKFLNLRKEDVQEVHPLRWRSCIRRFRTVPVSDYDSDEPDADERALPDDVVFQGFAPSRALRIVQGDRVREFLEEKRDDVMAVEAVYTELTKYAFSSAAVVKLVCSYLSALAFICPHLNTALKSLEI